MNNEDIISGCLKFDPIARKILYDKYSSQMYSVCLRYASSKDQANDIFQEAFYLVYKNLKQIRNTDALSGWVKRIFVNTSLETLKKNAKYIGVVNLDEVNDASQNWNDAIQKINTEEIGKLIRKLPKGCRMVFNLYVIEGYSHKEISEQLSISVGTSKSQLHDARKTLKKAVINLEKFASKVSSVA